MQKLDELQIRLVRAAALRGPFEPRALLHEVLGPEEYKNKVLRARLLSSLLKLCSVEQSGKHAQWLLRPAPRERALAKLDSDGVASTGETTDIALALAGQGPFTLETLDRLIDAGTSEETLSQLVVTLERAGQKASSYDRLFGLRSRLNMLRQSRQTDALLLDDFIGRLDEVKRIEAWIAKPQHKPPLKTLHIEGLPGIGKSFLLERITQITRAQDDLILIRLDFDRSSLQASDGGIVFDEISRQIGDALPRCAAKLRDLRLSHSEQVTRQAYESSDSTPRQLLHAMIDAVADANRRLVFLLDTLEVLHSQGSTYVQIMMEELDRFAEKGRIGISVISAGRGPIFTKDNPRLGRFISLETLEDELINTTLKKHDIAESLRPRIVAQAEGNPLKLRLLIDQAQQNSNVAEEAVTTDQTLDAGFVHRAIRSRLPLALRRIASEGLVLSELTIETLTRVVMPALGIGILERNAAELIDDLGQQRWLVSDDGMGRLTHQPDLRQSVLEHTYRDSPLVTAEVNRAARDFFADRDPVLNLYHGLQLMRLRETPPDIDPTLAERFPERLMRELPVTAQDLIRRARGQRSATVEISGTRKYETTGMEIVGSSAPDTLVQIDARSPFGRARIVGHRDSATPDARALNDLRLMLEQGQRREAAQILREGLHSAYDPASEIGVLILCHQWQSGFWSKARELFDMLPRDLLPDLVAARPQLEGRIILEILAEFDFGRLVERLADDSFRQRVVGVVNSSTGIGLRAAALDFALLAAGVPFEDIHQALGLIAPYLEGGAAELAHERLRSAQGIRSDFGMAFRTPDLPVDGRQVGQYAMALAPLNPYHDRLHALVSEFMSSGRGRVLDDMQALHGGLHEAAELFAPGHEGVDKAIAQTSDRPTDILALLRALGLTADWAEGYSFFHPITDLPTIARAASRWQQVVGGYWAYDGPEPKGWQSKVQFSQRSVFYAELVPTDDSARITDRMLRFWSDPGNIDSTAGTDTIRRRLGPTSQVLQSLPTRFDRLRHLSESRAPTVFHPALALIAEADKPPRFLETVVLRRPSPN